MEEEEEFLNGHLLTWVYSWDPTDEDEDENCDAW
jgi:hypothetical protein